MRALLIVSVCAAPAQGAARSTAAVDSLYRAAAEAMQTDEEKAFRTLQGVLALDPKHAPTQVKLGYLYLRQGNINGAERAFRQAIRRDGHLAEAYNGLGLVLLKRPHQKYAAMEHFHQAVLLDPKYAEAQYNLAKTHLSLNDLDAKPAFKELIEMAPDHPDAYIHLGTIYEKEELNYEAAIRCYEQQLKITPRHPETRRRLAAVYRRVGRAEDAENLIWKGGLDPRTDRGRLLLEIKQCVEKGEAHVAMDAVEAYLATLTPEERALYQDVRFVASLEELAAYEALPPEERVAYATRFWNKRDLTPVLGVNERLLEHYRRVAYAREFFSGGQQPWDRRGEVFIRYGEPDHTSRYDDVKPERDPEARAIKDRLAYGLGEALALLLPSADPFYVRQARTSERENAFISQGIPRGENERPEAARGRTSFSDSISTGGTPLTGQGAQFDGTRPGSFSTEERETWMEQADLRMRGIGLELRGRPVFPMRSGVPWEYWLYKDVDRGIEVVFTDERSNERYDYAPFRFDFELQELARRLKLESVNAVRYYQAIQPKVVMERAAARFPDRYRYRFGPALPSGFDLASFRGGEGKTRVEFYCGASIGSLIPKDERGKSVLQLERAVAVYDSVWNRVFYRKDDVSLGVEGADRRRMMIPDALTIEIPPGVYHITFQVKDGGSQATQVYRREVGVESYEGPGLQLSDVQQASSVAPVAQPGNFVKSGLRVIPMPIPMYMKGQAVNVYFEVYNLNPDAYGLSAYDITYRVRSDGAQGVLAKALAGAGRFLGLVKQDEGVAMSFEQAVKGVDAASYLAVDMNGSGPGRYVLSVEVRDRRSGDTAVKTTRFEVVER